MHMIYLDSSATSFYRPPQVAEAVAGAIRTMGNCGRGVHQASMESARVIFEADGFYGECHSKPEYSD